MFTPVRWVHAGIHSRLIPRCHLGCCPLEWAHQGWREAAQKLCAALSRWPGRGQQEPRGGKCWTDAPCPDPSRSCPGDQATGHGDTGAATTGKMNLQTKISPVCVRKHSLGWAVPAGDGAAGREGEKLILQDFCTEKGTHQCQPGGGCVRVTGTKLVS